MSENIKRKVLNLSMHKCVSFEGRKSSDAIKEYDIIIFAPNAKVNFNDVRRIPKNIDFRTLGDVGLRKAHLDGYNEVAFSKGATVNLSYIERGPRVLNVSMCKKCTLAGSTLYGTEKIIFRDKKQLEESQYNLNFGADRIVFRDDTNNKYTNSNNIGPDGNKPLFSAKLREWRSLG